MRWEATHITVILVVIATLGVTTHLAGTPQDQTRLASRAARNGSGWHPFPPGAAARPALPVHTSSQHNATSTEKPNLRQITVGASGIKNRYTLLNVARKPLSPELDELIVKLDIESLAIENLVSPFESDMLEIRSDGLQSIKPKTPFRAPIPSGNTRNEDITFVIPSSLNLKEATLRIHYYADQKEIPLNLLSVFPR